MVKITQRWRNDHRQTRICGRRYRMNNRCLLGAGVALALALGGAQAQAQWFAGPSAFYFGGEGGWTSLDSQSNNFGGTAGAPAFSGSETFNDGYNVGARAGYMMGPLRLEEEFSYRNNSINGQGAPAGFPANGGGAAGGGAFGGNRTSYAIMTNAIYDFNFGWPISPHLGGGIGLVDVHEGLNQASIGTVVGNDSWQFGYQGIAGIRYFFTPIFALDLDYRYLATTDASYTLSSNPKLGAYAGTSMKSGYSSQNFVASLTILFGPPPPPPVAPAAAPAPPPPPPQQVYLVFFDWDKYTITREGMQIVQKAAAAWKSGAPVQIHVTGYTDTSGSPGYNQRLSERRANAVASALVRLGVPRSEMVIRGRGENDLRVPTPPGVREPQNRRVEIIWTR
ncbi:MAG TPA: OmpA family protein [Stellaceae bacterium]|nr:OmpA family protein [Stellaceae bacterium]